MPSPPYTYVALFRGINVGGRNKILMKELVSFMEECGKENIRTYIQSGNVVFSGTSGSCEQISDLIFERKGFRPEVLVLGESEFMQAVENNPYGKSEGKACHFYFCFESPGAVDETRLNQLKASTERYSMIGNVFYLFAPEGIGRSKLAANVERCLGVAGTSRNLNTVNRLWEMLKDAGDVE